MTTGFARVRVLFEGYVRESDDGEHAGSTITLITEGDTGHRAGFRPGPATPR